MQKEHLRKAEVFFLLIGFFVAAAAQWEKRDSAN